jgi:eukaryotic-like serine/threonine-protein kinase
MNERLSHYRILEKIGQGGMGVVYRARDERLERDVALKVLAPSTLVNEQARRRLAQEARSLSRLHHPNVAMVFDFDSDGDESFLVMEWVPGETLDHRVRRGVVDEAELVDIARQIADALIAAHDAGVIHRDLKPANLRRTPEGRIKVLDFGLARRAKLDDHEPTLGMSDTIEMAGTCAYMPPETLRGTTADGRGDLYAVGVVLYELATGRPPFVGESLPQLIHAILQEPLVPPRTRNPAISPALQTIILRLLQRDPERRYPSARAFREDLDRKSATSSSASLDAGRTLAVLPLENLSGDPAQDYFADGMTEAIIGDLARIRGLRVISRTSIMRFKGARRSIPEIASELNAEMILEGSVLRGGDRVRVSVQLIDPLTDTHVWAERFDRPLRDVLELQSDLAQAVAAEIRLALQGSDATPAPSVAPSPAHPIDPEVFDLYLRGRHQMGRRGDESLHRAADLFEQSLARDPSYSQAQLGLAEAHALMGFHQFEPPLEAFPRGRAAAERALAVSPELGEAEALLGYITLHHDRDWEASERRFLRAIDLNPNHAMTRLWYANLLGAAGRFDEGHEQCRRALELDPLSPIHSVVTSWLSMFEGRYEAAYEHTARAIELDPGLFQAQQWRGWALWKMGRLEQASDHLKVAARLAQHPPTVLGNRAVSAALAGRVKECRVVVERMMKMRSERYVSAFLIALALVAASDLDAAEPWIERAAEERSPWINFLRVDPRVASLRGRPRGAASARRLGEGV